MEVFKIIKIGKDKREVVDDFITEEVPLTLTVNDKELVTLLSSPYDIEDLVKGFLFTSGLINNNRDVKKIVLDEKTWTVFLELAMDIPPELVFKRLYTPGCGKGVIFYNMVDIMHKDKIVSEFSIEAKKIGALTADFQNLSEGYFKTGGVHSAAVSDGENILVFREDIGRHNAIDKVIGRMISENNDFHNKILMTSGRISSEVLLKAQKCKFPMIISRSAPTNQSIKLARYLDITMVGFARAQRMNIYSKEERII